MVWLLVRFNYSYDAAWSVSDMSSTWSHQLTMSTHTCSMDVSHSDSVDRLLQRLLDASHADTTRYHVTDSTMTTSSNDDERHDDVTPVESAAWLEEYWSHTWTTLITLDLLLIAARATVTYVNAVEIYRGGRRTPHQSLTYDQPAMSATDNHCIANGQAGSAACPRLNMKTVDRTARQSTWSTLVDAVSSRSLLTVVYLSSLVALLYLAARVATSSAAVDVIIDVIYDIYTLRVRTHRSMSDAVVREQARLTTSTMMQSAQQFDLLALRVFDQYFRLGKSLFLPLVLCHYSHFAFFWSFFSYFTNCLLCTLILLIKVFYFQDLISIGPTVILRRFSYVRI